MLRTVLGPHTAAGRDIRGAVAHGLCTLFLVARGSSSGPGLPHVWVSEATQGSAAAGADT